MAKVTDSAGAVGIGTDDVGLDQVAAIEGNAGKPIYQMSKWWARRRSSVFPWRLFTLLLAFALLASPARAQEMEPRSYSNSPIGTRFFLAAYTRSEGNLSFDASVPVSSSLRT